MQASCFGPCAPEMLDSDQVSLLSFATSGQGSKQRN